MLQYFIYQTRLGYCSFPTSKSVSQQTGLRNLKFDTMYTYNFTPINKRPIQITIGIEKQILRSVRWTNILIKMFSVLQ